MNGRTNQRIYLINTRLLHIQFFDIKIANLLFTAKTAERKIV